MYVTYTDEAGNEQKQYFPVFVADDANNLTKIQVGGTTYNIPKACSCSITKNADGSYTVKAGDTQETITVPTVPAWTNTYEVTYNNTTGQFEISTTDGKKVAVPKGTAEVSVDATTGVATVTSSDGATTIKLQKTQPVVYTDGAGNVAIQNYDLDGNPVGAAYALPTAGQFATLTSTVNTINTNLTNVQNNIGTWDATAQGKTLSEAVEGISSDLNSLETKVSSMFEAVLKAIAASITNIQVEEVMSNALGSYNGMFTNLKSTKLVGYFGTTDEIVFPKHDPQFYKPAGDPAMTENIGDIQLTVNPIGTNFSGVSVSLVNSLGQESSIKLSNLESSDKLLTTGLTRADGSTGLYKTTATVEAGKITTDNRLHIAVDKSVVKNAVKDFYNDLKNRKLQGGTINELANAIHNVVTGIQTERLAVKTEYTTTVKDPVTNKDVTTTKSIVSPYDLSGVAVQPLGFESLPEQYRDSLRFFNRAKTLLKKLNTRIAKKIIKTVNQKADLANISKQINDLQIKIKKVKAIPESMKIIKQKVDIDTTITIKVPVDYTTNISIDTVLALNVPVEVEFEAVVPDQFEFNEDTKQVTVIHKSDLKKTVNVKQDINFVYSRDVQFKNTFESDVHFWIEKEFSMDISDIVDNVNNALDVVTSVNGLCESANKIFKNVYEMEGKLLAGNYLNRIFKYIDKASAYSAKGIYKLFQPVLLVNSESGFGFAGIRGVPATVSGKVEVIPTTYSNGLVAPVYKKYISVNGANGKVLDEGQVTLDITSDLKTGINTVEYYAVDYFGNEIGTEYVIIKK